MICRIVHGQKNGELATGETRTEQGKKNNHPAVQYSAAAERAEEKDILRLDFFRSARRG